MYVPVVLVTTRILSHINMSYRYPHTSLSKTIPLFEGVFFLFFLIITILFSVYVLLLKHQEFIQITNLKNYLQIPVIN